MKKFIKDVSTSTSTGLEDESSSGVLGLVTGYNIDKKATSMELANYLHTEEHSLISALKRLIEQLIYRP